MFNTQLILLRLFGFYFCEMIVSVRKSIPLLRNIAACAKAGQCCLQRITGKLQWVRCSDQTPSQSLPSSFPPPLWSTDMEGPGASKPALTEFSFCLFHNCTLADERAKQNMQISFAQETHI